MAVNLHWRKSPVWPAVRVSPAALTDQFLQLRRQRREFLLLRRRCGAFCTTAFVNCWITGDVRRFAAAACPDAARQVAEVTAH